MLFLMIYTQGGHKLRFFKGGKAQFVTVGIIYRPAGFGGKLKFFPTCGTFELRLVEQIHCQEGTVIVIEQCLVSHALPDIV
jgi:hypothetical protein